MWGRDQQIACAHSLNPYADPKWSIGIEVQINPLASRPLAPITIIKAHDVVFSKVIARLHLDDLQ